MNNPENGIYPEQNTLKSLAQTGLSLALLVAMQVIGLPNWITGIAVNAVFIFVFLQLGLKFAAFLAILSPVGGLVSGHLPAVLYPLVPVIIVGNLLLISIYSPLKNRNLFLRLILPSLFKASFIFLIGMNIISWLEIGEKLKWLALPVLGIQFITSCGGILLGEKLFSAIILPMADEKLSK